VFEFTTTQLGAQGTVLAGGRYDGLVKLLGGPDIPGIGFAAGVERLVSLMGEQPVAKIPIVAVIPMQEVCEAEALALAQQLRKAGIRCEIAYKGNAKKRMERANKIGASHALMLGEVEQAAGQATLKDLKTGAQETLPRTQLMEKLNVLR
jgi:histidyl-tRNA synthetase